MPTYETPDVARYTYAAVREFYKMKDEIRLPEWEASPDMRHMILNSVGRLIRDPDMTPESCFGNWYAWSVWNGWRHGEKLSIPEKINPRLMPWDALPAVERDRTALIIDVFRLYRPHIPMIDAAREAARTGGVVNIINGHVGRLINAEIGAAT